MPYDLCSSGEVGAICHGGRVTLLSQLVGEHSRRVLSAESSCKRNSSR